MLLGCINLEEKWAIYRGIIMNGSIMRKRKGHDFQGEQNWGHGVYRCRIWNEEFMRLVLDF